MLLYKNKLDKSISDIFFIKSASIQWALGSTLLARIAEEQR